MPTVEIAIILLLTMMNGILAMSEMAIVSSRKARLQSMAKRADAGARAALDLIADPSRFLSTVQIGITLVGIFAGAYGGATLAGPLGDSLDEIAWIHPYGDRAAIVIVVVAITYLSLVIGELVPKRIALANPERTASLISRPMQVLSRIAAPAVWLLRISTDSIIRLLQLSKTRNAIVSEEEVKSLIAEGTRAGIFAPQERDMIGGVLRLADRSVRAIMTQRSDIAWVDQAAGREAIVALVERSPHTEFLVADGSVDSAVGLVGARDLLRAALHGEPIDLAKLVRPTLFVAEQTPVFKLIDLFRRQGVRIAVVVDEYGGTEGIVTATDVLEGIAGALPDRDEEEGPGFVQRPDGSWLVDGLMPVDEFEDVCGVLGLREEGDFETIAGFIIYRLGRLPKVGDRVERDDMMLEVVDMDGRRIDKVLVTTGPANTKP
jgi:magnesium and cobalt exporter, CNNM family